MRVAQLIALLAGALAAGPVRAQTPQEQYPRHRISNSLGQTANVNSNRLDALASDTLVTGTITSTESVTVSTQGRSNLRVSITGTWTGTITFEGSVDGTTWIGNGGLPSPVTLGGGAITPTTSINGTWESRVAGFRLFRMRGATVTSGSATVSLNASAGNDYAIANLIDDAVHILTSTAPLAAGASITTGAIDMRPFVSLDINFDADVASTTNGCVLETSVDGTTWSHETMFTFTNTHPEHLKYGRRAKYMRFTYTNGTAPQTRFAFQVFGQRVAAQNSTTNLTEVLDDDDTAAITRSVLTGRKTSVGNGYANVSVTAEGALNVNTGNLDDALTNSLGTALNARHEVQVALLWPHGFNTRIITDDSVNGGSVTYNANNQNATLATGVAANGGAGWHTNASARFTPQQAVRMIFSTRGFTCVVGNRKIIGVGTDTLGYFIGCDPVTGLFGVMYRSGGTDHWIPRASWNGYKFDGTTGQPTSEVYDPTMSGFYAIDYRMGTGTTQFFMAFPGKIMNLMHELRYRNTALGSGVAEGFLPARIENVNVGSTANNTMLAGPMAILAEVGSDPVGVNWAYSARKNGVGNGVPTNLFTLRNNTTWNGTGGPITNRVRLRLQSLTAAVTGGGTNATALCELALDATVAGVPAFTDINAQNSIAAVDTAGTTVSGGSNVYNLALSTGTAQTVDVSGLRHRLNPGERWVFTCQGDGATVDVRLGASWVEEW